MNDEKEIQGMVLAWAKEVKHTSFRGGGEKYSRGVNIEFEKSSKWFNIENKKEILLKDAKNTFPIGSVIKFKVKPNGEHLNYVRGTIKLVTMDSLNKEELPVKSVNDRERKEFRGKCIAYVCSSKINADSPKEIVNCAKHFEKYIFDER